MKIITLYGMIVVALMCVGLTSETYALADNVDPLTGKSDPNRSCLQKDDSGNCFEWKVLVDGQWIVERSCKGPCTVVLERDYGPDVHRVSRRSCLAGFDCRAQLPY